MQSLTTQERLLACYQRALGHDLPNKLVALQGLARLLDEELAGQLNGEARDWLARVVALSREVDTRIRALAEVGRACKQAGPVTTNDLHDTWLEVRTEIACQTKDRVFCFDGRFAVPAVVLPGRAFRRVLAELLRDVIRRSPPGKDLRIVLSTEPVNSELVLLSLQDNAPPPTGTALEQAFEPRLDDPHGSGLGLFLVRLLVEGWGGTISLSAPSEGGCLVAVQIPQTPTPNSART